ncbi:MAG: hypothetical protein JKX73_00260 [Flavobacteriales bacterium]|nr:hypothetical protein [Flavobacteriales bacterium]
MSDKEKGTEESEKEVNATLHELLLKQQALLLQQSDYISKTNSLKKEDGDAIDLSFLVPRFMRRGKEGAEEGQGGAKEKPSFIDEQFNLIYSNRVLLTLFLFMGIAYSVYIYAVSPKLYKSTMTVASGFFDNTYYASLLYPLENLSQSKSYVGLSKTLRLDTILTKNLVNLKYRDFLSKDEAEDKNDSTLAVINRPYFKIDVVITDNSILPILQKGIFNYMNNNIYVNKQLEIRKEMLGRTIYELQHEADWLDTLKKAIVTSLHYSGAAKDSKYALKDSKSNPGEIVLSREDKIKVEAVDLFMISQDLGNEIIERQTEELQLRDNLQTVGDFSANSAPLFMSYKNFVMNTLFSLALGLTLIYGMVMVRYMMALKKLTG